MVDHFLLIGLGSAGDVYPFLAIGKQLRHEGYRVTCAVSPYFARQVQQEGMAFLPLGTLEDYERAMASTELWHPRKGLAYVTAHGFSPAIRPVYDLIARQDLSRTKVVASTFAFGARLAAEKLAARVCTVHLQPSAIWSKDAPAAAPGMAWLNRLPKRLRHWALNAIERRIVDPLFGKSLNAARQELGLPGQSHHILSQWVHSPYQTLGLFPSWFAPPAPDWPPFVELTGFAGYSEDQAELSLDLQRFLDAGESPLLATTGSAMGADPDFLTAAAEAACRLGRRILLVSAAMAKRLDTKRFGNSVQVLPYAPFSKLLPRVCAIIHHGGIGTVAQALAAGLPQLVRPYSFDQPDNAEHLKRLGVAEVLAGPRYDAAAIASGLTRLFNKPHLASNCQRFAHRVDFAESLALTCRALCDDRGPAA